MKEVETYNGATFRPEDGDFIAGRQRLEPIVVWNINGSMCIAHPEDPIYITKEQAIKFFGLIDPKED